MARTRAKARAGKCISEGKGKSGGKIKGGAGSSKQEASSSEEETVKEEEEEEEEEQEEEVANDGCNWQTSTKCTFEYIATCGLEFL